MHQISKVVLYCRTSTRRHSKSIHTLGIQESRLRERAEREGWTVVSVQQDEGISGSISWLERPGLVEAVRMVRSKEADALMITKVDRLSCWALDAMNIAEDQLIQRKKDRPRLICLEPNLDVTTGSGMLAFQMDAALAEYEAGRIKNRIRIALAERPMQGDQVNEYSPEVLYRIASLRLAGLTLQEVADVANDENLPTLRGGSWRPSNVSRAFSSDDRKRVMDQILSEKVDIFGDLPNHDRD